MPVYEYECETCGVRFDRHQSFSDAPIRQCPECAGVVHKVFHPAGIIFKGSGWYITDSRNASSGTVTGDTKPSAAGSNGDKKETSSAPTEEKKAAPEKVESK